MAKVASPLAELDARRSKSDIPRRNEWEKANRAQHKKDAPVLGPRPRLRRSVVDSFTTEALREILVEHGGKSDEDARETLNQLTQERRYARDVY